MPVNPLLSSINSGEFSPRMEARVDFDRYPNAAKMCRNFVLYPQGGLARRPGSRFIKEVANSSAAHILIPFVYSQNDSYILEHGDEILRFYRRQGRLEVETTDAAVTNGAFGSGISGWDDISTSADFPTVAATDTSIEAGDVLTHDVDLPTGITAGNLLVIILFTQENAVCDTPSGWTLLGTQVSAGRMTVFYKVASGSEGGTVAVTQTGADAGTSAHHAYRIDDFSGTPEIQFSTASLDPPSISPTWGSTKALFITAVGFQRTDQTGPAAPANYTDLLDNESANTSSTLHVRLMSARRAVETGTENPGVFSLTGTAANHVAATIAIQPTAVAGAIAHDATNDRLQLTGINGAVSGAEQAITISAGNINKVHVLNFRVDGFGGGTVGFQVGTATEGSDVLDEVTLGVGHHAIEFTPGATTFYIQFYNDNSPVRDMFIDDVAFISNAPVSVASPFSSSEIANVESFGAADVVYLLHPDYWPRRVERRGHRSWSVVEAFFADGPYLEKNDGFDVTTEQLLPNPLFENGLAGWDTSDGTSGGIVVLNEDGKFAELVVVDTSDTAVLKESVTCVPGARHTMHILVLAASVLVQVGSSDGGTSYVNTSQEPGWATYSFITTGTTIFIEFTHAVAAGETVVRAGIGGCLIYPDTARLLQCSATTGSVTVRAHGFAPFTAADVGRLIRFEYPGQEPGYVVITAEIDAERCSALVMRRIPDTDPTEAWSFGAWGGDQGFPTTMTFFDGRSVFAATEEKPQTIWFSQSADLQNMRPDSFSDGATTVEDDDAINITLEATQINPIFWLAGQRSLMVGTGGGEWVISSNGAVVTPTDISAKQHAAVPCGDVKPIEVNQIVLFTDRARRELYNLGFSFEDDSFIAHDLTILADHVFASPVAQMVYQRAPYSTVWCRRTDGRIAVLSFNQQHEVLGWSQVIMGGEFGDGQAVVESIAVIPGSDDDEQTYDSDERDEVWVIVKRTIDGATVRYVEMFEYYYDGPLREDYASEAAWQEAVRDAQADAFYVDSGLTYDGASTQTITGLDHLEGETVSVLADGKVHPPQVVTSGEISLDFPATTVHAGLSFKHRYESLKFAPQISMGTSATKTKIISSVGFILLDTGKFSFTTTDYDANGRRQHPLQTMSFLRDTMDPDSAIPLFTGERNAVVTGTYSPDARLYIEGEEPLPFVLLGLAPILEVRPR